MPDVFLSHATANNDIVIRLHDAVETAIVELPHDEA